MLTITQLRKFEGGQWRSDTLDVLPDKITEGSILWVDAEDPSEEEITQLASYFKIEKFELKDLSGDARRSKIEENEDSLSCFVRFPNRDQFTKDSKRDWITLTAGKKWILSVHKGPSAITCEIYKKISTHGYFALSLVPSTDILLYIFLDLVTSECFIVSDMVHEKLQVLSQEAANLFRQRPTQSNSNIGVRVARSRDQALAFRQLIGPLREVVGKIARGEFAIVSSATLPRFEDLYDRTISLIEVADTHREEIHDIGDILINFQTVTTNNIISVLTIISAIFLPLTLIAGIYGTNFGHGYFTPGSNSIYGFYAMIVLMFAIAVGLITVFRRKGWL